MMRSFRFYVYMEQDDLNAELPTHTGSVSASSRAEADRKVDEMFPGAYYFYCLV